MGADANRWRWNAALFALYVGLLVAGFPFFQYAIDPDGTSYLALAHRWAAGDFARAVNGYWSPWSIWLTAGGLKLGLPESVAAVGQFALGGGLFLALGFKLIRRQPVSPAVLKVVETCLVLFVVYAVYIQWFNDLWAAAFGLWALEILSGAAEKKLFRSALFYGLALTLAYYAKTYYLPFLLLLTGLWMWKAHPVSIFKRLLFTGSALLLFGLLCLPWWAALHSKYGIWTTGTAGPLNLSWGLLGHPVFGKGIVLLPPVYPDSPSYWEDPWWSNVAVLHFWDSAHLLGQVFVRSFYFTGRLLGKAALVTPLLPLAGLLNLFLFLKNLRKESIPVRAFLIRASLTLFPLPLLMIHSEARYLWFLVPLLFVWIAQQHTGLLFRFRNALLTIAALGLLVSPLSELPGLWQAGAAEKAFAEALQKKGVNGGFATALPNAPSYSECLRLAHFLKQPYWPPAGKMSSLSQTAAAIQKEDISYLFLSAKALLPAGATIIHRSANRQFVRLQ